MTSAFSKQRIILFVIGSLELGGAEQHVVQIAEDLKLKVRGWMEGGVWEFIDGAHDHIRRNCP